MKQKPTACSDCKIKMRSDHLGGLTPVFQTEKILCINTGTRTLSELRVGPEYFFKSVDSSLCKHSSRAKSFVTIDVSFNVAKKESWAARFNTSAVE